MSQFYVIVRVRETYVLVRETDGCVREAHMLVRETHVLVRETQNTEAIRLRILPRFGMRRSNRRRAKKNFFEIFFAPLLIL